ncbi:MAG: hypothetical protein IKR92_04235 [Alphaproteobacteria bacterium]|nr:hypothetical protein [Alphaproteobacteria bacterium]
MEYISSPRAVITAKKEYAKIGNELNAIFLSNVMHDNDAVRKLVHNRSINGPDVLKSLWLYYAEHRNKNILWDDIRQINETTSSYGSCGIYADIDKNGRKIITDWRTRASGDESLWADLKQYDKRYSDVIYQEFGNGYKKYNNVSVAQVLSDTISNRTYAHTQLPHTPNNELNLLLRNLYNTIMCLDEEKFSEQTYYKALQTINNDLETAFSTGQKLRVKDYVPAIIFLDESAGKVFDKIDYHRQRSFYRTPLGQESLRFTYLTSLRISKVGDVTLFNKDSMHAFLDDVKAQTLWQVAQSRITNEFMYWGFRQSISANRWLELNVIKPQPHEKVYAPYYQTDLERAEYMNLYKRDTQR